LKLPTGGEDPASKRKIEIEKITKKKYCGNGSD